jgi:hypothetical protein
MIASSKPQHRWEFDLNPANPYTHRSAVSVSDRDAPNLLPPRSMVGQATLTRSIGVRIPGGQPKSCKRAREARFSLSFPHPHVRSRMLYKLADGGLCLLIPSSGRPAPNSGAGDIVCKRAVLLSITHKLSAQDEAELYVCEACKSSPHNGISWWRVFGTCEVASEAGKFSQI